MPPTSNLNSTNTGGEHLFDFRLPGARVVVRAVQKSSGWQPPTQVESRPVPGTPERVKSPDAATTGNDAIQASSTEPDGPPMASTQPESLQMCDLPVPGRAAATFRPG